MNVEFPRECKKCRKRAHSDEKYCPECGTKITGIDEGQTEFEKVMLILAEMRRTAESHWFCGRRPGYPNTKSDFALTNEAAKFGFIKNFLESHKEQSHE